MSAVVLFQAMSLTQYKNAQHRLVGQRLRRFKLCRLSGNGTFLRRSLASPAAAPESTRWAAQW